MKTKTIKSKEQIMSELKSKHDKTIKEIENSEFNKRAYVNLPITLLERTFFDMVAKEVFHLDQTKLLRSLIRKLMVRHPDIVEKAKRKIEEQ